MYKNLTAEELKKLIDYHDNLYYNEDNPEIPDFTYDQIKQEYLVKAGLTEVDYVPGSPSDMFGAIEHTEPILSLAKINTEEELRKELLRLAPGVIQPKIDGLTLVLYPQAKYVSRGNGLIGEDLTTQAKQALPHLQWVHNQYPVRMEVYMDIVSFLSINRKREKQGLELFKNPRNAAAGMLRNKDVNKIEKLDYLAYNLVGDTRKETEQLQELSDAGFQTVPFFAFDESNIEKAIHFCTTFNRSTLPYDIDGLVIKSNVDNAQAVFGSTGHHPKNMCAWKFRPEGEWTTIQDIFWQTGRTGRVSPVAIINPVDIGGSTISRVTLHNIGIIKELGIKHSNQDVYVIKANDVIPAIVEAGESKPDSTIINELPDKCPACHGRTLLINDQLFCLNAGCNAKLLYNICHLAKRDALDIEGLSEQTAQKMIDTLDIHDAFQIFDLTKEDLLKLEGFADKSATNLYNAIQSRKTNVEFDRFIYAASLPLIGRTASKNIARKLDNSYEELIRDIETGCSILKSIDGIGPKMIWSLTDNIGSLRLLKRYLTIKKEPVKSLAATKKQLTFVITGTLSRPRSEIETAIAQANHKTSGSVSKKTDYLICGADPGGTKYNKAQELGIKMITEKELEEVLYA